MATPEIIVAERTAHRAKVTIDGTPYSLTRNEFGGY